MLLVPVHPSVARRSNKTHNAVEDVTVLYDRTGKPFTSEEAIQSRILMTS